MLKLVVATRNRGKIKEIQSFLAGTVDKIFCAADFENFPETIEDGETFDHNSLKKAREAMEYTGFSALADDSGLVVGALGGRPGVYSARFAGDGADDEANNRRLLKELEGVPQEQRKAAFVCSLAYVAADGTERLFTGRIDGRILEAAQGSGGFGYDPFFLVEGIGQTMAELAVTEKNRISHRGQALRQFREYLESQHQLSASLKIQSDIR
ncbi:XTP/dITP diphosphatase [Pelotalea chapellei]|uniref:dITP/XTP pyrophosphatase n=1 Tax=Pelotalea chapellei TaxID=44671 RepID=A0ABS5U3Z2_9BACT|nr:XTP/dITP diphosphatase [Pelotalea chapellei]MBT1070374.1 XTP/dITP diphosphatase [Pelotalea chapellei]